MSNPSVGLLDGSNGKLEIGGRAGTREEPTLRYVNMKLVLVALIAGASLAACGGKSDPANGELVIPPTDPPKDPPPDEGDIVIPSDLKPVHSDPAFAAEQAALAAKLNDEGKELMFAKKYAEASSKFREAVARVPDAKYFFNLCTSLFQEGKFSEALVSCDAVDKNVPTPELAQKSRALRERILAEARNQGIPLEPTATPEPIPSDAPSHKGGMQTSIAAQLNDEGVKLMTAEKYAEASFKFRDAVARVPEPKYFFNLCTSLFQEGKFSEALTACSGGKRSSPNASLGQKLDKLIAKIRAEASAQGIPLEAH
jgi:tetratricopeptide (TPR) repeat protein